MLKPIIPNWIGVPDTIAAFSTTRCHGLSSGPYGDGLGGCGLNLGMHVGDRLDDVLRNRALLYPLLPSEPVWLSQVHGIHVVDAGDIEGVPEADASITTQARVVCAIMTADCLPVLFSDVTGRVVGAAHAGWRGLANGVLENTVAQMRDAGAGEIIAWMGPAIGPEYFEVGEEVVQAFFQDGIDVKAAFHSLGTSVPKYLANIYLLARQKLVKIGIDRVFGGEYCTVRDSQEFYSYRRDKVTGRMASLIFIK